MTAKILHSLTDDNPNLQRQIGCMNGIFQVFNRQPIINGVGRSSKRLPTGNSHYHDETVEKECNTAERRSSPVEKCLNNNMQERQRASIESFSSSRSSSFSSLDYNSSNNLEQVPSRMNLQKSSPQSLHLRDVVKDSMYREVKVLPRFKDFHHNEQRELLRSSSYHAEDGSSFWVPKDAPRFSYDEREISYIPYESRDIFKSIQKLKDLQRHSLDSRNSGEFGGKAKIVKQESRSTSIVAKLMGLESLPGSRLSAEPTQKSKLQNKAHSLPRGGNLDSSMKHISRFSIESTPKKQIDVNRLPRKPVKPPNGCPSVYSEIEKRLKDLEFAHSGKDLRALKQILEAMHAKGLLQTPHHNQELRHTNDAAMNSRKFQTHQVLPRHFESPIIIMKPATLVHKSALSVISFDGFSGRPKHQGSEFFDNRSRRSGIDEIVTERNLRTAQTAEKSRQLHKEFRQSSDYISPRVLRKKLELEMRSKPVAPHDAIKSRRQSNKEQEESSSPGGPRRTRHPNDGLLFEGRRNFRNLKHEISVQSNGGITFRSNNVDVPSLNETSPEIIKECYRMIIGKEQRESRSPPEYPSPVSVLEYTDDSTSPIKPVGKTLKGYKSVDCERFSNMAEGRSADDFMSNSNISEINAKKLHNIENLVHRLRRLKSSHDETHTDYIAPLCESTHPDHRYISEILLASGLLLRDLDSSSTNFQFHTSVHPINPELFLVLEQTKLSSLHREEEKAHRILLFNVVNEILARKLVLVGPFSEPWSRPNKLAGKAMNAQKLLKDLCTEIEQLQTKSSTRRGTDDDDGGLENILFEDLMHQSENWNNFNCETSGIILYVERSIFKDLVDEVVVGVAAGLKTKRIQRR